MPLQLMSIWILFEVVTGADGQATEHWPEYWVPMPKEALVEVVFGAWVGVFDVVFDVGCLEVDLDVECVEWVVVGVGACVVGGGACVTGGATTVAGGISAGAPPQAVNVKPRQAMAPQVKAARRLVMLVSLRLGVPNDSS